ncbi:hypothetical protein E6C76_16485 [Pseudothauera nasutitermitis]|uniref:Uncharacterized protein n=1 Tax=Pseudothauera nasutitermitis TaxID=2565930 RepID=A0A4S4ASN8_9RHOO|nr:hypothetical protein [Pseudothauera nasutitermitis]THF62864.1 hypothetical protein E6C76_16485 [Pseudothauera nasutitermitis]
MDTHCPHCSQDLRKQRVLAPERDNAVAAGEATHWCPVCRGGLVLNTHPAELKQSIWLDPEIAVYLCLGSAIAVSMILAGWVPPLISFFVVVVTYVAGAIAHRAYFYEVTLADWPRYRAASLRFIEQISPKS